MKSKKKLNVYVKVGLIMLVSAAVGGLFGFGSAFFLDSKGTEIRNVMADALNAMRIMIFPLLAVLTVVSVFWGERSIRRMKQLYEKKKTAQEQEYDLLDAEEERIDAAGMVGNTISQALCFIILSFGYSGKYIADDERGRIWFLAACVIWLVCYAYDCFWQVRMVKLVQKEHSEMQAADPSSTKFQQQWLAACDEAEREIIYQSSYKTYMLLNKCIPVFLLITMLSHLLFETGAMAVIIVAAIWLIETICYSNSCVKMQKSRIN